MRENARKEGDYIISEDEDKSQYFNAWNFGETVGEYFATNESVTVCTPR